MHRLTVPTMLLAAATFIGWLIYPAAPADGTADATADLTAPLAAPFAVVELFTSEGCSSCPPADRLLERLDEEARASEQRVFALSFHVDYWNYLGWRDPYSDAAFSERQRTYTRTLRERTYTPQMIVNGQHVFVGSNEAKARNVLQTVLDKPALVQVAAEPVARDEGHLRVRFAVENAPEGTVLHLALTERGLSQRVRRGENAGRTLTHTNVVRAFTTVDPALGEATLSLPDGLDASRTSLIAYAQDPTSMRVLGATRVDV